MDRQPLVPGERICMPELFVNCEALSPNEELFLAGNLSLLKRLCHLFRELALGANDFGGQFWGVCSVHGSFQLFVILHM